MNKLWIIVVWFQVVYPQDIRQPPSITKGPQMLIIYRHGDDVLLECEASGVPQPEFEWRQNNILVSSPNTELIIKNQGTIRITAASYSNQGYYQCFVSNMYGAAVSVISEVKMAVLDPYKPGIPIVEKRIQQGHAATIDCPPIKSVPKATHWWSVVKDTMDYFPMFIVLDRRVQIDENGNLNFAYVTQSDERNGYLYKCNAFNPSLDITTGGGYTRITVVPGPENPMAPAVLLSSSEKKVIVLEKSVASIRCFFAGKPVPSITWSRKNGMMPNGRYKILSFNTEMLMEQILPEDEGEYMCTGVNYLGLIEHTIFVDVQAAPVFKASTDRPQNLNVTDQETATFRCSAYAEPAATVLWLQNGVPLNPNSLPPFFQLSPDHKELSISNVCKQCPDGRNSLMVIQCNASNVHGYAFAQGFLNVLERTVFVTKPESYYVVNSSSTTKVEFHVSAKSDPSTIIEYKWYKLTQGGENLLHATANSIEFNDENKTLMLIAPNTATAWLKHLGVYRCKASNGYSMDYTDVVLRVDDRTDAHKLTLGG